MFLLKKPTIDKIDIYNECVLSILDIKLRESISNYKYIYLLNVANYDLYANNGSLCELSEITLPTINHKNFVNYKTIKDELIKMYDRLHNNKRPRLYYDKIRSLSKKCPFCGFGQVYTLDHYLPKSIFPIFSILPYNLVPCCRDCNTKKGNKCVTSIDIQTLHPYYDDILSKRLVFAKIIKQNPMSIKFYVKHINKIYENRVKAHFQIYELSKRFAIEAAERINELNIKFMTNSNISTSDIKQELCAEFKANEKINPNSWQCAMYEALYKSDWYCKVGYKQR